MWPDCFLRPTQLGCSVSDWSDEPPINYLTPLLFLQNPQFLNVFKIFLRDDCQDISAYWKRTPCMSGYISEFISSSHNTPNPFPCLPACSCSCFYMCPRWSTSPCFQSTAFPHWRFQVSLLLLMVTVTGTQQTVNPKCTSKSRNGQLAQDTQQMNNTKNNTTLHTWCCFAFYWVSVRLPARTGNLCSKFPLGENPFADPLNMHNTLPLSAMLQQEKLCSPLSVHLVYSYASEPGNKQNRIMVILAACVHTNLSV